MSKDIESLINEAKFKKEHNESEKRLEQSKKALIDSLKHEWKQQKEKEESEACYIATMVYGDYNHEKVIQLRKFRDYVLKKYCIGRLFIRLYYKTSPSFVKFFKKHKSVNKILRYIIDLFLD